MKNILFDLGTVALKGHAADILNKYNIDDKDYNKLLTFFKDTNNLDLGNESLEEKYNRCNFPKEFDTLYKDILINYYKVRDINLDVIDLINKIKENGYTLYVLSDNNKEVYEYFKNNELFKSFDIWVMSCNEKAVKKDGKLFDVLIDKYKVDPKECYFIDDNIINITEAKKRGFNTYLFDEDQDIKFLYNDMKMNGIEVEYEK